MRSERYALPCRLVFPKAFLAECLSFRGTVRARQPVSYSAMHYVGYALLSRHMP